MGEEEFQHVSDEEMIKKIFLSQPREVQLESLRDVYKKKGFGAFKALAQIALDAPCGESGGIPTEVIAELHNELLAALKD